jgi:ABC-type phosphate transport system substrate-binding protein
MRRPYLVLLLAFLAGAFSGLYAADVAIIVNKGNSVDAMTAKQLKQIFAGEKARWADGQKIQTLATGAATPEHKVAIRFLFGMSEPDYQKYCLHATFVGTPQLVPRDSGTSQAVLNFVALIPGAIGFIRADLAGSSVKVVKIDGMSPGDAGYPLTDK